MWRVAARCLILAGGFSLAACSPALTSGIPGAVTASAGLTSLLQPTTTLPLQPAPTATSTPLVPTSPSFTPIPTFTATGAAEAITPSATQTAAPPLATATAIESVSLDKLPPGTVYKSVRIQNQSRTQMDISLHCTTIHGLQTVLEYNSVRNLTIQAPEGDYVYVVYVGGRRIVGGFSLLNVPSATITVYADRVAIH